MNLKTKSFEITLYNALEHYFAKIFLESIFEIPFVKMLCLIYEQFQKIIFL